MVPPSLRLEMYVTRTEADVAVWSQDTRCVTVVRTRNHAAAAAVEERLVVTHHVHPSPML